MIIWTNNGILVGFNPFQKNMLVKLDHFPKFRGENKPYLKPPPSIMIYMMFYHALRSNMEAKLFTSSILQGISGCTQAVASSSYITSLRENKAQDNIYIYNIFIYVLYYIYKYT